MKKHTITALLIVFASGASAQIAEMEALKYSQTQIKGTARYMGLGGAFTSLGGDISSITDNPAGIAVYRSKELAATVGFGNIATSTKQEGNSQSNSLFKFTFDNLGYVGTVNTENSESSIKNWNFGFVYNRKNSYNRNYRSRGNIRNGSSSLTDYIANKTNTYKLNRNGREDFIYANDLEFSSNYNPYYDSEIPWLSILGYQGFLIDAVRDENNTEFFDSHFVDENGPLPMSGTSMDVSERGYVDDYNIALGMNYSHMLYVGLSLGIQSILHTWNSTYSESFENGNGFDLINTRELNGSGVNFNIGFILRPTYSWRIGLAYHSPTFYSMTSTYWGQLHYDVFDGNQLVSDKTGTPGSFGDEEYPYTDFNLVTPQRLSVGTSFLGEKGLLSIDYEFCDFSMLKIKDDRNYNTTPEDLDKVFTGMHTIKLGGELRLSDAFSLRAGYAHSTSPMTSDAKNGKMELFTSGTVPHYTVEKGRNYFSAGFGYRNKNIFLDMVYALNTQTEDIYPFAPVSDENVNISPTVSTLTTARNNVLLTFGVKF
ncbi:MAG: outer membrane protein transport protein [Bacteroidales bacterium]|jgi:long-subunit fatty acid transport protein|nr:outer membrane protein transport protein [Bacteroidales bacterium]